MVTDVKDFSNWPDWEDSDWQKSIYRSLSNMCDGKDQRNLTSVEKEILEALEKKGFKPYEPPSEFGCIY